MNFCIKCKSSYDQQHLNTQLDEPVNNREPIWTDYLILACDGKLYWEMGEDNVIHWKPLPSKPKGDK